jgi:hypothetical protein
MGNGFVATVWIERVAKRGRESFATGDVLSETPSRIAKESQHPQPPHTGTARESSGGLAGKRLVRYDARLDSFPESQEMPPQMAALP